MGEYGRPIFAMCSLSRMPASVSRTSRAGAAFDLENRIIVVTQRS
jgi:hypothetical protein